MHKIEIYERPDMTFEVKVGCKWYFFLTKEAMLSEVSAYVKDPDLAVKAYESFWRDQEKPEVKADPGYNTSYGKSMIGRIPNIKEQRSEKEVGYLGPGGVNDKEMLNTLPKFSTAIKEPILNKVVNFFANETLKATEKCDEKSSTEDRGNPEIREDVSRKTTSD